MSKVYLVGAGPGDPKLLTRRAYELLLSADLVIYDALVSPQVLALIPPQARLLHVGKRAGVHALRQEEINALLIELAQAEQQERIVRLKGGDPFVFGRGGEEMLALREAGIPYEVVPGVTAGLASPAYFDIPITHRGISRSFTCITAYTEEEGLPAVDWDSLARLGGSLVFYMGVRQVAKISTALLRAGLSACTPAALLSQGTTPRQRLELRELQAFTDEGEDFTPFAPALFLVGEVLSYSQGRAPRPLEGKKVLVTRARHQASSLQEALEAQGAEAILLPTLQLSPLVIQAETFSEALATHRWIIFTSPNAVAYFFTQLQAIGLDARALGSHQLAVIGPMTAQELQRHGLRADFQPSRYSAEAFAEEFLSRYPLQAVGTVLLPCSELAQDTLPIRLAEAGISYTRLPLYANCPISYEADELREAFAGADWLTACSSSAIHHLHSLLHAHGLTELLEALPIAALGEQTAAAARSYGLTPTLVAPTASIASLVQALCKQD